MKIDTISLPHPVLGRLDDVNGSYKVDVSYELGRNDIKLKLKHNLSNSTLENLIKNKKASYSVEIVCVKTIFRKTFNDWEDVQEIVIPALYLRDKVSFKFFITANDYLANYTIEGSNTDYDNYSFEINKGDVLAYGEYGSFFAEKGYALLAVTSFMVIDKYEDEDGPIYIDLSDDKVIIRMCKKDYEKYTEYKSVKDLYPIFHSSIVFPTLLHILYSMRERGPEYEGLEWYENLDFRLNNEEPFKSGNLRKLNSYDIPKIAQLLLKNPLERSLVSIEIIRKKIEEN